MKKLTAFLVLSLTLNIGMFAQVKPEIQGELKKWHTIRFIFDGPSCSETTFKPNPFLDYRFEMIFTKDTKTYRVPGFFAADGESAESGAVSGNKWQVNFVPDETGTWTYQVSFRSGDDLAISNEPEEGTPIKPNGATGSFVVSAADPTAPGFLSKGRLEYVGERYLKFRETGEYFLKGGADSPENFLAYVDFDQTFRYGNKEVNREGEANPKAGCHKYEAHEKDWKEGDPTWQGAKGKGIIGALNYLASQGVNSQYMLMMNIMGDGKDVWPYTDYHERTRFDCSKLAQWDMVFNHMERLGIMLHLVLQETENECLLDCGQTGLLRKLYLRELVARFGHHLAITWNLGEENGPTDWSPIGQTDQMRKDMANYLKSINPYPSFVVLHTHSNNEHQDKYLNPMLGFENLDGPSMQIGNPENINNRISHYITESAKTKKPWVVMLDELGPAYKGIMPDESDAKHDTVRHEALWGSLMAGAAGVEWYFGYRYPNNDLNCEDFRSRNLWWKQNKLALDFFRTYLPFAEMKAANEIISPEGAFCLAKTGEVYAIYLPKVVQAEITLPAGKFTAKWFNPRTDGKLLDGSIKNLNGGVKVSLGMPPAEPDKDWVVLITKTGYIKK
ncbi:MAG: DUF5060 domain-containing protein [Prolixibacteraceae bacterium]